MLGDLLPRSDLTGRFCLLTHRPMKLPLCRKHGAHERSGSSAQLGHWPLDWSAHLAHSTWGPGGVLKLLEASVCVYVHMCTHSLCWVCVQASSHVCLFVEMCLCVHTHLHVRVCLVCA